MKRQNAQAACPPVMPLGPVEAVPSRLVGVGGVAVEQQVAAAEADAGAAEQLHDADGLAVDQYGVVGVEVTQDHPAAWGDRDLGVAG